MKILSKLQKRIKKSAKKRRMLQRSVKRNVQVSEYPKLAVANFIKSIPV